MSAERPPLPVRLVVTDDLHRSRLTVFFRWLLAIPHYLWIALLGTAAAVVVFINWFIVLFRGQTPQSLHDFLTGFLRYATRVEAYVLLASNPFPGFYPMDDKGYPIDLEFDPPAPQNRWKTFFRLVLAIPGLAIGSTLVLGGSRGGGYYAGGLAFGIAFLLWWVGLVQARSPRGLRDLLAYCMGYTAHLWAYLFLVTDRYPYTGPNAYALPLEESESAAPHPVSLSVTDDLRRSRVLVFFRIPVVIPHVIWWLGWTLLAFVTAILMWIIALVIGRPPRPFHRFVSAYLRYTTHLTAFFLLIGNPFPGFVGKRGSYPVDLQLPEEPQQQRRLVTLVRLFLAIPALLVSSSLSGAMWTASFFAWFVALVRGQMPDGIRNLGGLALRYSGQTNAYLYLLTERYPHSGPRPDPASP